MADSSYKLIDSGNGRKLELFGKWLIDRPCAQAAWKPNTKEWKNAHARFAREDGNVWEYKNVPESWNIEFAGLKFKISPTDFGHLGIFPEQKTIWQKLQKMPPLRVLNLFAYSGGATLAAAKAGAEVCHLDASKGMVSWAKENAKLNNLQNAPIRWIVDDVIKFLKREQRRERQYDGIILDPPSFGRGSRGEIFKIERDLPEILDLCKKLLSKKPAFFVLSCHTPGYTPQVLQNILQQTIQDSNISSGEMLITGENGVLKVPSGAFSFLF